MSVGDGKLIHEMSITSEAYESFKNAKYLVRIILKRLHTDDVKDYALAEYEMTSIELDSLLNSYRNTESFIVGIESIEAIMGAY